MKKKLTESQLQQIISNSVKKILKESVFGLNGNDLTNMGIKNPADNYNVNYQELTAKIKEFLPILKQFHDYIYGVEEEYEEDGETYTRDNGVYSNMRMRGMWNDNEDETYYADELRELCSKISSMESTLNDILEWREYEDEREQRRKQRLR